MSRREVQVSDLVKKRGRPRVWGYGYGDLAKLLGKSEVAVRQDVKRGRYNPGALGEVCEEWRRRCGR